MGEFARRKTAGAVAIFAALLLVLSVCGCGGENGGKKPPADYRPMFAESAMLHTEGKEIKDADGNKVTLRGINAGGYLVLEPWMCAIEREYGENGAETDGKSVDHKNVTETMVRRFGKERTLALWKYYRSVYWVDDDFANCADMGFNVIRLPFTYMSVDPLYNNVPDNGEKYNFEILDEFVRNAEAHGMYTVLDLHGAYGSQNGQHHSGQILPQGQVGFYSDEENMQKTEDLWRALAEHFKDNPAVAAYDLLNEPAETQENGNQLTEKKHWDYFDRLYKAIREADENHIIAFESCWEPSNLPNPATYGWENCVYSLHHYSWTSDYDAHIQSVRNKKTAMDATKYDVPVYMGEFSCFQNEQSWTDTLKLFEDWDWSWTGWTYKLDAQDGGVRYGGWAVYTVHADNVDVAADSYFEIIRKWLLLRTSQGTKYRFRGDTALYDVYAEACKGFDQARD